MNKQVLNQNGISLAEKAFEEQGFSIEKSLVPRGKIDFFCSFKWRQDNENKS